MQRSAEKLPAARPAGIFQSGQKVEAIVGAAGNLRTMAPEQPFLNAMKGFRAVIGNHNVMVEADCNKGANFWPDPVYSKYVLIYSAFPCFLKQSRTKEDFLRI